MAEKATVLAADLGAESGRVAAVTAEAGALRLDVLHRFENRPVTVRGSLHWDVLALFAEVAAGIEAGLDRDPISVGVDAWGVDFALLDGAGELLGNPWHYRDARTDGALARLLERVGKRAIFERTGIQFLPFNTLVQLFTMRERQDPRLDVARTFLTIPDLFHYWLTGERACEYTNATTTQLLDARERTWSGDLLAELGLRGDLFPEVVPAGTSLGTYGGLQVVLPASHDTGSAVAGIPATARKEHVAFVSSGTWSLVGTEVDSPVLDEGALLAGLTNEGGADGGFRLLKNVMGLWILQQCRKTWASEGTRMSYAEIVQAAEGEPALRSVIPVNDPAFLPPGDHPAVIRRLCALRGEPVPETPAAVARCVIDSLALGYRQVLRLIADVTGRTFQVVHVVGGGSRNSALNQATADATGVPVLAGPTEATLLGNAAVQLVSLGAIHDLAEARGRLAAAYEPRRFEPRGTERWAAAAERVAVAA